jgi:hypothetical protein
MSTTRTIMNRVLYEKYAQEKTQKRESNLDSLKGGLEKPPKEFVAHTKIRNTLAKHFDPKLLGDVAKPGKAQTT